MDNFTFGFTVTIVGMGGTLVTMWFLTLVVDILKRFFPYRENEEGGKGKS
jgi:Na+-transporting methylmalonyl-CoA/oxaloacetate decarboxylase gamma subunit